MVFTTALINGTITADDTVKLLILLLAGVALLLLARWASALDGGPPDAIPGEPAPEPFIAEQAVVHHSALSQSVTAPSTAVYSFPYDPSLGAIRVTKFFFKTIDPVPGPPDPEVFADELFLELYEPESDHYWGQSYLVATPRGLAQILKEKSWRYLHAHEILVFPRYDLAEIQRAVVTRILTDHDFFQGSDQQEEPL